MCSGDMVSTIHDFWRKTKGMSLGFSVFVPEDGLYFAADRRSTRFTAFDKWTQSDNFKKIHFIHTAGGRKCYFVLTGWNGTWNTFWAEELLASVLDALRAAEGKAYDSVLDTFEEAAGGYMGDSGNLDYLFWPEGRWYVSRRTILRKDGYWESPADNEFYFTRGVGLDTPSKTRNFYGSWAGMADGGKLLIMDGYIGNRLKEGVDIEEQLRAEVKRISEAMEFPCRLDGRPNGIGPTADIVRIPLDEMLKASKRWNEKIPTLE